MERSHPVQRAKEHLANVTSEAQEMLRICEYVEKSRIEKPHPQILIEMENSLAELASRENTLPLPLSEYKEMHSIYEMFIRILASTEKPMHAAFMFMATDLVSDEEYDQGKLKSALWQIVDRGPIIWTEDRRLTLTPEVREQFK